MISAAQRAERVKYACSSDLPAILGVDPYRSAADVWLEKTGRAAGFDGNDATDRGALLEPVLVGWAERVLGGSFVRDFMAVHPSRMLAANLDAYQPDEYVVEAKTTVLADEWGDEGTDQVPDRVLVQTHHQMIVAGDQYRTAYVPVLLPGYRRLDFRLYKVRRNDELARVVEAAGVEFMERFVRADTPPDDYRPSLDVLKRVRREPEKVTTIPDVAVSLWQQAKAKERVAKEERERAEADVIACMGDAEGATCTFGTLTYMETRRAGYTVEPSAYRSLRFEANKESK